MNCVSQLEGNAVLGDLFSGTVSLELGRRSGTQLTGEDKTKWRGLWESAREAHLSGTFLAAMETPLCEPTYPA